MKSEATGLQPETSLLDTTKSYTQVNQIKQTTQIEHKSKSVYFYIEFLPFCKMQPQDVFVQGYTKSSRA